jgi:hypothetical protein
MDELLEEPKEEEAEWNQLEKHIWLKLM